MSSQISLSDIVKQASLNNLVPLGIVSLTIKEETEEFVGKGSRFFMILKVSQQEFDILRNTRKVIPTMDFIPTEHFPNLWFRLKIDDGSKLPNGCAEYFSCEYQFNILSESHKKIIDDISRADKFTILYSNPLCTQSFLFHFTISKEIKAEINAEIAACRNGFSLYSNLNTENWTRGCEEMCMSRDVSGEVLDSNLVKRQSSRRFSVEPFPIGVTIEFK